MMTFLQNLPMNENVITMVTESTNLKGNIATESNVLIAGEIHGDVESKISLWLLEGVR